MNNSNILIVAVYVDDTVVLSNNKEEKILKKNNLMKSLNMNDLGEIHKCFGIRVCHDLVHGIIPLDLEKYIEQVLHHFNMSDCNGAVTPLDVNQKLFADELLPSTDEERDEMKKKQSISGSYWLHNVLSSNCKTRHCSCSWTYEQIQLQWRI